MVLIHRAYHPQTSQFIYWDAAKFDENGNAYDQSEPFNELENITVVARIDESTDWGIVTNRKMTA
jgi:hypothetical protein